MTWQYIPVAMLGDYLPSEVGMKAQAYQYAQAGRCYLDSHGDAVDKYSPNVLTPVLTAPVNHAVAPAKRLALGFLAILVEAQQCVQVREGSPLAYCGIAGSKRTQRRNVVL
jgi:hypothetical protein